MICLSPMIDKNLDLIPSFNLEVSFIMDNMNIIPNENILTITNDPIYYPFEDSTQLIKSNNIIQFDVKYNSVLTDLIYFVLFCNRV